MPKNGIPKNQSLVFLWGEQTARRRSKIAINPHTYVTSTVVPSARGNCTNSCIIWAGNPISLMNMFKTHSCQLCMRERVEIAKWWLVNLGKLINLSNKIFGVFVQNAKFQHFMVTVTDEDSEKVKSKSLRNILYIVLCLTRAGFPKVFYTEN